MEQYRFELALLYFSIGVLIVTLITGKIVLAKYKPKKIKIDIC